VSLVRGEDYEVRVSWLLLDDERLNKRSKNILVKITDNAVEDILDASSNARVEAVAQLERILNYRLESFNENHDADIYTEVPLEVWVIDSKDIFL
jgi:hypothetical protein